MTTASSLGPVSAHIRERLGELLDSQRVVVWYDAEGVFRELVDGLALPGCVVASAVGSALQARRQADMAYRQLEEGGGTSGARQNLLIYVPAARGATSEEQQQDPFEGLTRCGAAFGSQEGESLLSLAQLALPEHADEIARLFCEGRPSLDLLDSLPAGARFPLLRQALGTDAPIEVVAAALSRPDTAEKLQGVPGSLAELDRLVQTEFGFASGPSADWPALRERLCLYLLVSELAFDLPAGLPDSLAAVDHATDQLRDRIFQMCDRLRAGDATRDAYMEIAGAAEDALRLSGELGTHKLGHRDTFPVQERARLRALVQAAERGHLGNALAILADSQHSVWRRDPERALLWQAAQRCLHFLQLASQVESSMVPEKLDALVGAYAAPDGLWRLDRAQRLYEQAGAQCAHDDEVDPLLSACRARYRSIVERMQASFQSAVVSEGWPPEGVLRQTQTFDRHIAPDLSERRKTAYFLVDSLRYEMGRDLAAALQDVGVVSVEGVCAALPTTTPCGMAALLPGADGTLTLATHGADLVPSIGDKLLPSIVERREWFRARYGDRFLDITLDELLSTPTKRLGAKIGSADLVVVRTQDIDAVGETTSIFRARKVMSDVLGELRIAAMRLADIGFEKMVFAADHGHILVPETLAGDALSVPAGEWVTKKRRSLLGKSQTSGAGVLILRARDVGIVGPIEEVAVAAGLKTFQSGTGYFHEGLSLQECIVPVVVIRAEKQQASTGGDQVAITYRSDRFTSSVIGLKLTLTSMFSSSLSLRLEAFEDPGAKARSVGQAGDCDAWDPATGEVSLRAGEETQVPLVVDPDYRGPSIDIRAVDPRTGAILARLQLDNARMD